MYCEHYPDLNFQTNPEGLRASVLNGGHAYLKYFGQSSFAGYALASERNAIKVTKDVPLKILGPLGCGVQTGAGTVMNGLRPHSGSTMVVLGTGAVGLSAIMGALICGCSDIIAVSRTTERLEFARTLGATDTINTNEETDLAAAIRARLPAGADYIVDAAGAPSLMGPAIGGLGKLGTLALVAVPPTVDRTIELPWLPTLLQGQSISGFVEGNSIPDVFIPQMIELYRLGRFPFDRLLEFYPFDKINEAVEDQIAGKVIKAVLEANTA
jgi:aryl-alcohol dehydrogenase